MVDVKDQADTMPRGSNCTEGEGSYCNMAAEQPMLDTELSHSQLRSQEKFTTDDLLTTIQHKNSCQQV